MQARLLLAIGLLLALPLSGCLEAYQDFEGFDTDAPYRNAGVFEGAYLMGNGGSMALIPGLLRPSVRPEIVTLISERPAYGAAAPVMSFTGVASGSSEGDDSRVDIKMAIWRPDNYTLPTPIIVDAGPYYEQDDLTLENQTQSTPQLVTNLLPRGYTVVQLAVRGTGTAGGCMDLFGPDETADLDQALRWLGEQPWSNGNIGLMGVSYDGSTPWTAAGTGNPYVKTIVPISGLPDIYDLMLHNGSAETRAAFMHGASGVPVVGGVYWGYGFSKQFPEGLLWEQGIITGLPEPPTAVPSAGIGSANGRQGYQDRQNLICPEALEGQAAGRASAAEGSRLPAATAYWTERDHRDDVLANYQGSVFLVHGLQDWNVDPHSAIPFNTQLRARGLEVKEWYGQWDHAAPDSNCQPGAPGWAVLPCRMDFGEVLTRWFDRHLLGYSSALNNLVTGDPALLAQLVNQTRPYLDETQRRDLAQAQRDWEEAWESGADWETLRPMLVDLSQRLGLLDTGPAIQVQDNLGIWRNADSYPPAAPDWQGFTLGADGALGGDATGQVVLKASVPGALPTNLVQFTSEPFPDGVHISGLPQVKVPFSATSQGGFLSAWLFDVDPNGLVRQPLIGQVPISPDSDVMTWKPLGIPVVGHAQMNLRFHAGGETPSALVPGERYVAQVEFEPLEVHIPAGHRVALWLFQHPYPDHSAASTAGDVTVYLDEQAQLLLPTVQVDPRTVFPVPGVSFPNTTYTPQMYTRMPVLDGVSTQQAQPAPAQAAPVATSSRQEDARLPCLLGCAP